MPDKPRLLFFDIFRIVCVLSIVYSHFYSSYLIWFNEIFYPDAWSYLELYPLPLNYLAVYGLIFISGAVIEYNYKTIQDISAYKKFIFKRFFRLYPAYWLSLLFGIVIAYRFLNLDFVNLLLQFSGLFIFTQNGSMGPDVINPMGWFISTIFILYLLFPFLSKCIRKHPHMSMLLFLVITFVSRYFLLHYVTLPGYAPWRWFPLCNLFEFCLGIYIIQTNFFPKNRMNHPIISELADFSFYVFLFHTIVIHFIGPIIIYRYDLDNLGLIYYLLVIAEILMVSGIAMIIDKEIQYRIRKRFFPG